MPEVSRFFAIVIAMFYNDHPPPHFHVRYGEQKALIDIEALSLIEGSLSPRVLGLVVEWAALHREELARNLGPSSPPRAFAPHPTPGVMPC